MHVATRHSDDGRHVRLTSMTAGLHVRQMVGLYEG